MQKKAKLISAPVVGAMIWLAAGCQPAPQPQAGAGPTPGTTSTKPNGPPSVQELAGAATALDTVRTAVKRHSRLFPRGTTVESVTVVSGVATVDFSPEFNRLSNMGDSTESAVQKQLRAALSTVPLVEKMKVTVHGKPFDSQMTDWTSPFPVKQTSEEKEAAANQSAGADGGATSTGMKDR